MAGAGARGLAGIARRGRLQLRGGEARQGWAWGLQGDADAVATPTGGAVSRVFAAGFAKGPAKKDKKPARGSMNPGADTGSAEGDKALAPILKAMETKVVKVTRTPEELADAARRAKEYSRNKLFAHNAEMKDLQQKIKCMWAAINALPEEQQAMAKVECWEHFPVDRPPITDTPPIRGYADATADGDGATMNKSGGLGKKSR